MQSSLPFAFASLLTFCFDFVSTSQNLLICIEGFALLCLYHFKFKCKILLQSAKSAILACNFMFSLENS